MWLGKGHSSILKRTVAGEKSSGESGPGGRVSAGTDGGATMSLSQNWPCRDKPATEGLKSGWLVLKQRQAGSTDNRPETRVEKIESRWLLRWFPYSGESQEKLRFLSPEEHVSWPLIAMQGKESLWCRPGAPPPGGLCRAEWGEPASSGSPRNEPKAQAGLPHV